MRMHQAVFVFTITMIQPALSFALMCPGGESFSQYDYGMSPEQVIQACGKPASQKESTKPMDTTAQEWSYSIPQAVYMGGSQQTANGKLITNVRFDKNGLAESITVNGIGVGQTTICGGNSIQIGATKDAVKKACGESTFIVNPAPDANTPKLPDIKLMEFTYTSGGRNVILTFENGRLTDVK